jgi:hypothetical protein
MNVMLTNEEQFKHLRCNNSDHVFSVRLCHGIVFEHSQEFDEQLFIAKHTYNLFK